jgi:uncharacterized SAM-binding protein YcdF (DUF218 family)
MALFASRSLWLPVVGEALVHDDGPAKADIVVVLAGDSWGYRLVKAAELVRAGYAPSVLVSGPPGFYGWNECDMAIQYGVRKGYPLEWFIPAPHNARSTRDESKVLLEVLRRRNVHSFLLVTSNYHTARSRRIFLKAERAMGGGPAIRTVAAPDKFFTADAWWQNREGRKLAFMEWVKTITNAVGI